MMLFELAS